MNNSALNTKFVEEKMAPAIHAALVHAIFNTQGPMLAGVVFVVFAAGITAEKTGLPILWAATGALALSSLARLYSVKRYHNRPIPTSDAQLDNLKFLHNVAALVQVSTLGFWTFAAVVYSDDPIVHLIAISVNTSLTAGGAARAYGQLNIFRHQVVLSFGPAAIALLTKFTLYYVFLAFAAVTYIISLRIISANLTSIFIKYLTEKERSNILATHDALTALPNRLGFQEAVEPILAADNSGLCAFLIIDLDRFKQVNDTLGHPVGDKLLFYVAARLRQSIREQDIAARFGGDEFAVFMRGIESPDAAGVIAERIVETVGRSYIIDLNKIEIGASVGIAITQPSANYDTLLKNADLALYAAKASGRGNHCFFEPEMATRVIAERAIEIDFKTALAKSEFELHFQPIVNLKSGKISSCEALLRWNHPVHGFVPPADIIKIAQSLKMMPDLGRWIFSHACAECVKWPDNVAIAINVSPAGFMEPVFISDIRDGLKTSSLPPHRLNFEITEGALLDNTANTQNVLSDLHNLGVGVSLDDFGTGYSSLSYLHHFRRRLQKIKIDRTFLDGNDRGYARTVLCSIAQLATDIGLTVVVEGIETHEQLELISLCPIDEAQGYLFSKPLPAAEVHDLLTSSQITGLMPPKPANDDRPLKPIEVVTETSPADPVPTAPDSQPSARRPARQSSGRSRRGRATDKGKEPPST